MLDFGPHAVADHPKKNLYLPNATHYCAVTKVLWRATAINNKHEWAVMHFKPMGLLEKFKTVCS